MQWSRLSISWTSFSSPWVRARDSKRHVDLAIGRPIVPAHTGRGYRVPPSVFRGYRSTSVINLTPACDVKYAYAHSVSTTTRFRNPTRYMMCTKSQNTHANHPEN